MHTSNIHRRGAGSEYTAKSADSRNVIKFNLCGTVAGAVAPTVDSTQLSPQIAPMPHTHGVALQIIPGGNKNIIGPFPDMPGMCADLDTCDYNFNPGYLGVAGYPNPGACTPGSVNYNADSPKVAADGSRNISQYRIDTCTANPAFCSTNNYWCCSVKKVPCTDNEEIISYYDGSAPSFNLLQEGNFNGGISLTYPPTMNYVCFPLR